MTKDFEMKVSDMIKNKKIKTMIDFNKRESNSIKSIVVNSSTTVDVSTRFCKGKMLMFAKMSLKLFVYDIIDVFCFPDDKVKGIFDKNDIEKCFLYLNLTDTDSCSMFFIFICKLECCIPESVFRNVLFEIFKHSKIGPRLDVSDHFWQQFNMQNKGTRKVMGLYEVENLDNANLCTIAINPKEYFEKFKDRKINKKHKGVRHDTSGMTFESYTERISSLRQLDTKPEKKIIQKRLQVKNTNMIMTSVNKVKFASLNDKRYYGSDGTVSLPFGHPLLNEVREYKKSLPKIHAVIEQEKDNILFLENKAFAKNERLRLL